MIATVPPTHISRSWVRRRPTVHDAFGQVLHRLKERISNIPATEANVLGVVSLIFWSLVFVLTVKYLTFVMRADSDGEGGILALLSLLISRRSAGGGTIVIAMALFGAARIYGDGMTTPAISVLSAVEGFEVAAPVFEHDRATLEPVRRT